jgi:hypothetical protein
MEESGVSLLAEHIENAPNDWAAKRIELFDLLTDTAIPRDSAHASAENVLIGAMHAMGIESLVAVADAYVALRHSRGFVTASPGDAP